MRYTERQLSRFVLRDLLVDLRCARRDNQPDYAVKVAAEIRIMWPNRNGTRLDRYGWPLVLA